MIIIIVGLLPLMEVYASEDKNTLDLIELSNIILIL